MKKCILTLLLLCTVFVCSAVASNIINCDRFKLNAKLDGSLLEMSIDTDLPDITVVSVSMSRSYWRTDKADEYAQSYFNENVVVGNWKSTHRVHIDDDNWKDKLKKNQKRYARCDEGYGISKVDDNITVNVVVAATSKQFKKSFGGIGNATFVGKAVDKNSSYDRVSDEVSIFLPMSSPPSRKKQLSLNPLDLDVGQVYIISRQTPLMPVRRLSGGWNKGLETMHKVRYMRAGGRFMVLGVDKDKTGLWYNVAVVSSVGNIESNGWVNSDALLGQALELVEAIRQRAAPTHGTMTITRH